MASSFREDLARTLSPVLARWRRREVRETRLGMERGNSSRMMLRFSSKAAHSWGLS